MGSSSVEGDGGDFLCHPEPMPVGTILDVEGADDGARWKVRVRRVVEQVDDQQPGMFVDKVDDVD